MLFLLFCCTFLICSRRVTVSDIHQIVPKVDVFKVFSTERHEEEVGDNAREIFILLCETDAVTTGELPSCLACVIK